MRVPATALFLLLSVTAWSQQDTIAHLVPVKRVAYEPYHVIATVALGFADGFRTGYSAPPDFIKSNISGFAPILTKLEYGVSNHVSIAGTFGYDAFTYNLQQVFEGNNGTFTRYIPNNARIFSGGFGVFYHFHFLPAYRFDPFVGAGASINNIRYSAYPQGDSVAVKADHSVTCYLKAGARYYISDKISLYADAGYDKHALFSMGFSIRFIKSKYLPATGQTSLPEDRDHIRKEVRIVPDTPAQFHRTDTIATPFHPEPVENYKHVVNTEPLEQLAPPLSVLQFQLGKSVISKTSLPLLDSVATVLDSDMGTDLYIDGYADTTGKRAVNNRISLARAQSVKKYLEKKGISPERLIAKGHGSRSPAASNRTRTGRAKNRRVTLRLGYMKN